MQGIARSVLAAVLVGFLGSAVVFADAEAPAAPEHPEAAEDFPRKIEGWVPVKPGEHPRLLFRKSDVPALRERAKTPEGQAIIQRLKETLGGGDAMPTVFCKDKPLRYGPSKTLYNMPLGAFTNYHAAGFGLLYQLTGDKKYADLARQCVDKMFAGQVDIDSRYNWVSPGGKIRMGPILSSVALAYDLCYDAWPEDYRKDIVTRILNFKATKATTKKTLTFDDWVMKPRHHPPTNHWGTQVGGAGIVLLAIKGDLGADDALIDKYLAAVRKHAKQQLIAGFGDRGWHSDGTHPSRVSSNTGFTEFLKVARVAAGEDWITDSPTAKWITLRWMMEIVPTGERADEKRGKITKRPSILMIPHRGDYGNSVLYARHPMISHGGEFSQGFGAVPEKYKPAILWVYNHFYEPTNHSAFNAYYPHRAIYAFVNWPIGVEEKNPAELLPKAVLDRKRNYIIIRNRWQDHNDILITALPGATKYRGYKHVSGGPVYVWGLGMKTSLPGGGFRNCEVTHFETKDDGSTVFSVNTRGGPSSIAVDFSKKSGADALIIATGPGTTGGDLVQKKGQNGASITSKRLQLDGRDITVMTLQTGEPPVVKVDGKTLKVGEQTATFDGEKFVVGE